MMCFLKVFIKKNISFSVNVMLKRKPRYIFIRNISLCMYLSDSEGASIGALTGKGSAAVAI